MCEVSAETIRKAHAICPLTAIQSEYHLMHCLVEENGVSMVCRELVSALYHTAQSTVDFWEAAVTNTRSSM